MQEPASNNQAKAKRRMEPRTMYSMRVPMAVSARVKAQAEKWGVTPTEAVARLVVIGLDAEAGAYDPNEQFNALGFTLAAIADRLDKLDKVSESAARAATKAAMIVRGQMMKAAAAQDGGKEAAMALDVGINEAVEKVLREQGSI